MKICYFGIYDPAYSRNKNNIIGLKENGVEVIEITDRAPGFGKYYRLIKRAFAIRKDFDYVIVGFPGQIALFLARLIFKWGTPVILDLFVSYYDSIILERRQYSKNSFHALWFYLLDRLSCKFAHIVLMDTMAHADYISSLLNVDCKKILVVYVGMDEKLFRSIAPAGDASKENGFLVSFHGNIQILNGMDLVVKAFKQLENEGIRLQIIGGGPEYGNTQKLAEDIGAKNISFLGKMAPEKLSEYVSIAGLGLGFFSKSKKIDRVIANKIYEMIAMKVPIVTGRSLAMEEHFKHGEHIYYCERGDVGAIADAIRKLERDPGLRRRLTDNAYRYAKEHLTTKRTIADLLEALKRRDKSIQ